MGADDTSGELLWYAVQTKPQLECRVEQNLRVSGFETLAPTIRERSPLKIGTQTGYRLAPLFPGYIFARFVSEQHVWRIRRTGGVRDVVDFGNGPARVDDDVIELVRARVAELERRTQAPRFAPGENVIIQDGPLRNLVGIFERETKGCERVAVLLSAIHWRVRAVADVHSLAKVDAGQANGHSVRFQSLELAAPPVDRQRRGQAVLRERKGAFGNDGRSGCDASQATE
jgi:transcriptional antiterminator RfaH